MGCKLRNLPPYLVLDYQGLEPLSERDSSFGLENTEELLEW